MRPWHRGQSVLERHGHGAAVAGSGELPWLLDLRRDAEAQCHRGPGRDGLDKAQAVEPDPPADRVLGLQAARALFPGADGDIEPRDPHPLAFLIGVGIAVALSGALMGTLIPQVRATGSAFQFDAQDPLGAIKGILIVGGTICTLFAFDITLSPNRRGMAGSLGMIVRVLGTIGSCS